MGLACKGLEMRSMIGAAVRGLERLGELWTGGIGYDGKIQAWSGMSRIGGQGMERTRLERLGMDRRSSSGLYRTVTEGSGMSVLSWIGNVLNGVAWTGGQGA